MSCERGSSQHDSARRFTLQIDNLGRQRTDGAGGGAAEVGEEMIVGFEYIDCSLVENNLQGKADNLNEGSLSVAWVQKNAAEITLPQVVRSVRKAS